MLQPAFGALRVLWEPSERGRSLLLMSVVGGPLTIFYLIALPAERFGAFAWGALQFLTPFDVVAAIVLGFGVSGTLALNLAARRAPAGQASLTFGAIVTALLPSSLCCTTLIPSALAALGASAPVIMHTTGRFQGFFAQYSAQFIGGAIAAVLISLWLAARNLVRGCSPRIVPMKESQ